MWRGNVEKTFNVFICLLFLFPVCAFCGVFDFLDPLKQIERKILSGEYDQAEVEINSVSITSRSEGHFVAIKVINYLRASEQFDVLIKSSSKPSEILSYYRTNVMEARENLPSNLPLSSEVVAKANETIKLNNRNIDLLNKLLEDEVSLENEKRKLRAEEQAREQERLRQEHNRQLEEARKQREQEEADRLAKYVEEERARGLIYKAEMEKIEAEEHAAEVARKKKEAALKKECGDDYKKVHVGMPFSRVQKCIGTFTLTGQLNREDGVVSTYENKKGYVHVMEGVVVSWGLYPF